MIKSDQIMWCYIKAKMDNLEDLRLRALSISVSVFFYAKADHATCKRVGLWGQIPTLIWYRAESLNRENSVATYGRWQGAVPSFYQL